MSPSSDNTASLVQPDQSIKGSNLMTSTTWTAGNGNFNTAANWSNGVPTVGVDAIINGSVTTPLTVSYTAGADTANTLTTSYTTFAMSGGSLTLAFGSSLSQQALTLDAFTQSAGTLEFQNGGGAANTSTINGAGGGVAQTGGTIKVDAGALDIYGASSFAGTLAGAGAIALRGSGTFTFNTGAAVGVATLDLFDSATLQLGANLSYAGSFADQTFNATTTINLAGHTLSLTGPAFFTDGNGANVAILGGGTLALSGTTQFSGATLGASAALTNSGTVNETGYLQLGDGNTDAVSVINTGTWAITTGQTMGIGATSASSFTNSGTFTLASTSGSASVDALFTNTAAGTVSVAAGQTLQLFGNAANSGIISGGGGLAIRGGSTLTLNATTGISVATLDLYDSASLLLNTNFAYAGSFADATFNAVTSINLNGHTLSLSGADSFTDGNGANVAILGAGTLALSGTTQISGAYLGAAAVLTNSGTANQTGYFQLGDGNTDAITVTNTGTWNLSAGQTIGYSGTASSVFTNSGLLQIAGAAGTATDNATFTNAAAGTLSVASGDLLQFYGNASSSGHITGAGALAIRGSSTLTLNTATTISIATIDLFDSANLNLKTNFSYAGAFNDQTFNAVTNVDLNGNSFTLTGTDQFTDGNGANVAIDGPGTIVLAGTATFAGVTLGGTAALTSTGTVDQTGGTFQIGDSSGLIATAANSGTWNLSAPTTIDTGTNSSSSFTNTGLFEMTSTGGTSTIDAVFSNAATGTLSVASNDLLLFHNTATLSGAVTGAGSINVYDGATLTIASGATLTVADFGFDTYGTIDLAESTSYAGSFFDQTFNTTTALNLGGNTLTLAGPAYFTDGNGANVAVNGPGSLTLAGTTQISELQLGGTAALDNKGTVDQTGLFQIGDGSGQIASVVNTGTWDLSAPVSIGTGANSASTFSNAGLFEMTSNTGASTIGGIFTSTGTVDAVNAGSVIDFTNGGSFGGTLTGAGAINFTGGLAAALTSKITLSVAQFGLFDTGTVVTDSITNTGYAGIFTIGAGADFDLKPSIKFTLTGTGSLNGTINGGGTFIVSGKTANVTTNGLVLGGSAILEDASGATMAQSAQWTIGDGASSTAQLEIAAGALYEITADVGLSSNGVGAITNAGTFEKNNGIGTSLINPLVTNSGHVIAASGTLEFAQQFTNDGTVTAANGDLVKFDNSIFSLTGDKGAIGLTNGGNVYFAGFAAAAETLDFTDSSISEATIHTPGSFSATIAGFNGSNRIDLQGIQNVTPSYTGTTSAGTLTLVETINGNPVTVASLSFAGDFTLGSFTIGNDGTGGTLIQAAAAHATPLHATDLPLHSAPSPWHSATPPHAFS
jgi:hypothetical protein